MKTNKTEVRVSNENNKDCLTKLLFFTTQTSCNAIGKRNMEDVDMHRASLFREVGGNIRYYKVDMYVNLFGEWVVERVYGNIRYKKHVGVKINFFKTLEKAKKEFERIVKKKIKKGYKIDCKQY